MIEEMDQLNRNDTGERIKSIRKDMGMKQRDMAVMLGVSANYLCLLEKGKKNASLSLIRRLSRISGRSLDEIVCGPSENGRLEK